MDGDRPSLLERAPWVRRHKLDVREYYRMGEAGIFAPGERVELIEGDYRSEHPTPTDVLLLIEVADSSLRYDRSVKLPLHAHHGIPEVWIVNIGEGVVEMYRDAIDETYRMATRASRGEVLEPTALPGLRIAVTEVLG